MAYLNDVDAGGATRFKLIDKMFRPRRGMLVGWNNRRPDGGLNHDTLHHAMKVRKGLKYVITKWYRERPWGWRAIPERGPARAIAAPCASPSNCRGSCAARAAIARSAR
jgi:hypothetical protein